MSKAKVRLSRAMYKNRRTFETDERSTFNVQHPTSNEDFVPLDTPALTEVSEITV
jgi:hypothetical protein